MQLSVPAICIFLLSNCLHAFKNICFDKLWWWEIIWQLFVKSDCLTAKCFFSFKFGIDPNRHAITQNSTQIRVVLQRWLLRPCGPPGVCAAESVKCVTLGWDYIQGRLLINVIPSAKDTFNDTHHKPLALSVGRLFNDVVCVWYKKTTSASL